MNIKINETMKKIISHGLKHPGYFTIEVQKFNPRDRPDWVIKGSNMMLNQAKKLVEMGILKPHVNSDINNMFKLLDGDFIWGLDYSPSNLQKRDEMEKLIKS
jgi:hypothetical protein